MKRTLISISNIKVDINNEDNFYKQKQHSFKNQQDLEFHSMLPFPMIRRGCLAFLITDAAICTAEVSAILTGGGMQHSTYLEIKSSVN